MTDWKKFTGNQKPTDDWKLPDPPSWRPFGKEKQPGESRRDPFSGNVVPLMATEAVALLPQAPVSTVTS